MCWCAYVRCVGACTSDVLVCTMSDVLLEPTGMCCSVAAMSRRLLPDDTLPILAAEKSNLFNLFDDSPQMRFSCVGCGFVKWHLTNVYISG